MIIIRFQGGLGNQMFQYALYEELKFQGLQVKADLTEYTLKTNYRQFQLKQAFGISVDVASEQEIFRLAGGEKNFFRKAVRKYLKRQNVYKEPQVPTLETILEQKQGYLIGYWQAERWFPDVRNTLQEKFQFVSADANFEKKCKKAAAEQSVGIHVRMGDYLNNESLYGGICTKNYYTKAVRYICSKVENPRFYVISDEPQKAKEMFADVAVEEYICSETDFRDMQFMSNCRHNILANSSFSWWAAGLNQHKQNIVICPSKWNNWENPQDIYRNNWIKM
jgi:hypothetical protein